MKTAMKIAEGITLFILAIVAVFLIFCEPEESGSTMAFLWSLVWTKALGILLAAVILARINPSCR